jgi:transcriptional regulator with XRE-family HTH domain
MTTIGNSKEQGQTAIALRQAREKAGVTRARLAGLAHCSYSQISNIEAGAVPNRSAVLERALAALAQLEADHD